MPTPPPDQRFDYIARKRECGCVVAICHDDPEQPRWTAGWVRERLLRGYIVERVTTHEACELLARECPHGQQTLPLEATDD